MALNLTRDNQHDADLSFFGHAQKYPYSSNEELKSVSQRLNSFGLMPAS